MITGTPAIVLRSIDDGIALALHPADHVLDHGDLLAHLLD